jgi:hypothetical protein
MLQMTLRKACAAGLLCLLPLAGAGAQTITIYSAPVWSIRTPVPFGFSSA